MPVKRQDLAVRGALGDLNTNVQVQRELVGKVAVAAAEFEKKASQNRGALRRYSSVKIPVQNNIEFI